MHTYKVHAGVQGQPITHHGEMIQKQGAIKVFRVSEIVDSIILRRTSSLLGM